MKRPLSVLLCVLVTLVAAVACGADAVPSTQQTAAAPAAAASRPNIVLIFPDNLGWGEVGVFGSVRGVPTPRIDGLAAEGMRLNNFNVEFSCTVSRAALLTGRYAVRTGAVQETGITQWEITIAEALQSQGYATALFGKWHVGGANWLAAKRAPTDQGFDEWYGIPMTSDQAQRTTSPTFNPATMEPPYIWEGKAGEPSKKVKVFDLDTRRTLDRESALRGIAFMERSVKDTKPFFLYYPITQIHFPTLPHPDFDGKTRAGDIGDAMADVDYNTGLVLDAIKRLGIEQNTIVIWCTDNGAEIRRPWRGSSGPWSGFYNTVMEGGIRTPAMIRWPGHIPAGQVSNEIVHEIDLFPTLAAAIGADIVPRDRAIDGVNQLPFLEGKQPKSNRDSVLYFTNLNQPPKAVKWKDWKFHYNFQPEPNMSVAPLMRLFNLRSDPKEESDIKDANPWVSGVMDKLVAEFNASTERYPHVPAGARDPYTPPRRQAAIPDVGPASRAGPESPPQTELAPPLAPRGYPADVLTALQQAPPNFSGRWSSEPAAPAGGMRAGAMRGGTAGRGGARGDLGSGWGSTITVTQDAARLTVEYSFFSTGDLQPPIKFTFALDGTESKNSVMMGRGIQVQTSKCAWEDARLVITTEHAFADPDTGQPTTSQVKQVLALESPTSLVVETTRGTIKGGTPSTTKTTYRKL